MMKKSNLLMVATLVALLSTGCGFTPQRGGDRDYVPEDAAQEPRFVEPVETPRLDKPADPAPEESTPVVDICPNIAGKYKNFKGWGEEIVTEMIEDGFGGHTCEVTITGFGKKPMFPGPASTWHDNPEKTAVVFPIPAPVGWYYEVVKTSEGIEITRFDNEAKPDIWAELKP